MTITQGYPLGEGGLRSGTPGVGNKINSPVGGTAMFPEAPILSNFVSYGPKNPQALAADSIINMRPSNMKKLAAALKNLRSGTGPAKIAVIGTSVVAGQGAGNATLTDGTNRGWDYAWPKQFAEYLTDLGMPAVCNALCGDNGVTVFGTDQNFADYNPRCVLTAPFVVDATKTRETLGGLMFNGSSGSISWTPPKAFDRVEIYYVRNTAFGGFTVNVNGGANLAISSSSDGVGAPVAGTTVAAAGALSMQKVTFNCTKGADGANTINLVGNNTGGLFISIIDPYDSTSNAIRVYNMGRLGRKMADLLSTGSGPWAPGLSVGNTGGLFFADMFLVACTINDSNQATAQAAYSTSVDNLYTYYSPFGDVTFMAEQPSRVGNNNINCEPYKAVLRLKAAIADIPYIDIHSNWGSWATANSAGYMLDGSHPLRVGHAAYAGLTAFAYFKSGV